MKKLYFLLMLFLFGASLIYAQDNEAMKQKLQKECNEFAEKMVSGDMEDMWNYYSNDVISLPSYEPMIKGLDAVKASSEKMKESGMKMTKFNLTVTDVMQSGDFVVEIGNYELTMDMPGMGPWDDHGKYMNVWEKQSDGSMKLKAETWNTDVNPWQDMKMMDDHGGHMEMEDNTEGE